MKNTIQKKQLTADDLYKFLKDLAYDGNDLKKIDINYRHDHNSDVEGVYGIEEDLRDPSNNETLISICFVTDLNAE